MVPDSVPTVRLHGYPGLLRFVAPGGREELPSNSSRASGDADGAAAGPDGATAGPDGFDARWVWEGAVDGPGLAALVRTALVHGIVPCEVDGRPHRARAIGCWYDAGYGTVVVELAGRPDPLA